MTPTSDTPAADARAFRALRESAAASALDDRALLRVGGADRLSFLQGMLSNDVASLHPGAGAYALLLTEQGKVVAELRALALDDELWLDVPAPSRGDARAALERLIVADDVEIEELERAALAVRGPAAADGLARLAPGEAQAIAALAECSHRAVEIRGRPVRVARVRDLGVDGFHLWAAGAEDAAFLLDAAIEAGAPLARSDATEPARIAAGVARAGVDFDAQTLAPEVPSLARAISFRKGCYLGQEVVERIAARGHVNWLVVGLTLPAGSAIERGAAVLRDGGEVGRVSSVAVRPDDGAVVALARLRRAAAQVGTEVQIATPRGAAPAVVESAPAV
jgi:folate-binding protein YgfZ